MAKIIESRRILKSRLDAKQDVLRAIPALMGDGNGNVAIVNQPGYVYVRIGDGDLGQAFSNRCPQRDNLAVYVGYDPVTDPDRRTFQVLSVRMADYAGAGNTPIMNVPPHHAYHEYGGGDDTLIDWRRIMGMRVGRPSGFSVTTDPGVILRAGVWTAIASQTLNLTALKPAGLQQARYVLIVLDATGVATATPGALTTIALLTIADCPIPAAGEIPLGAVRLYGIQTSIGDTPSAPDIIDLRFPQASVTGTVFLSSLSDYARGSIIRGGAAVWESYALGGIAGSVMTRDATDVIWSGFALAGTVAQTYTFPAVSGNVALGAGTLTNATINDVTIAAHTHAITGAAWLAVANTFTAMQTMQLAGAAVYPLAIKNNQNVLNDRWTIAFGTSLTSVVAGIGAINLGTANSQGGLVFYTKPSGGGPILERMRIDDTGAVSIVSLTASTVIYANASQVIVSLANAAGVLTNDGAGALSWSATATPTAHAIDGAAHTVAGRTAGQVLIATAAATFGWSGLLFDGTAGGKTVLAVTNTKTLTFTAANDFGLTFTGGNTTLNFGATGRAYTFPDTAGNVPLLETANYFTLENYIKGDKAGTMNRLSDFGFTPTDHFRSGVIPTGFTWQGAPFSTPTVTYSLIGDYLQLVSNAANQRSFLSMPITNAAANWQNKAFYARVSGRYYGQMGIRCDDGTDDNYVEFYLDSSAHNGMSTLKYKTRAGGGAPAETASAIVIPDLQYLVLRLFSFYSGGNYYFYLYVVGEEGIQSTIAAAYLYTWAPSAGRIGLVFNSTVAGTGVICTADWLHNVGWA